MLGKHSSTHGANARATHSLPTGVRCWESPIDPSRRFCRDGDRFFKIDLGGRSPQRQQDLSGEYRLLRQCRGVPGVPEPLELIEDQGRQVLVMRRLRGEPMSRLDLDWARFALVMLRLGCLVWHLARRGVRHNDLRPENILISPDQVHLIDFDQASTGRFVECLLAGFLGRPVAGIPVHNGFAAPLRKRLQARLAPRIIRAIRGQRLRRREHRVTALPPLPANAGPALSALHQAWRIAAPANANSPGEHVAYYHLEFGGLSFPGERPWAARWRTLRHLTSYESRRVLELGCNMALLSTLVLAEARANAALAVDRDPKILEAAAKVAQSFGVRPEFRQVDLDRDPAWEATLEAFQPDVVIALSVLNWVADQARFLAFLGRFAEVIYEGHDSAQTERRRLQGAGFTEIDLIATSDRGRPLLLARKPAPPPTPHDVPRSPEARGADPGQRVIDPRQTRP